MLPHQWKCLSIFQYKIILQACSQFQLICNEWALDFLLLIPIDVLSPPLWVPLSFSLLVFIVSQTALIVLHTHTNSQPDITKTIKPKALLLSMCVHVCNSVCDSLMAMWVCICVRSPFTRFYVFSDLLIKNMQQQTGRPGGLPRPGWSQNLAQVRLALFRVDLTGVGSFKSPD